MPGPFTRRPVALATLRLAAWLATALGLLALGGCSSIAYYAQAARGQFSMLAAARPIDDWLADPATPATLKERLRQARAMRAYASRELGLPDNRSYTRYADLHRAAAVWNVFAAPELSLQLKTWCYPLFGCAAYRGYFEHADAEALAGELRAQGWDAVALPVPAYSTLGWLDDPLLSTFIQLPPAELARLIFHELAHQVVYVKDDTTYNESYATAVEREGVRRWLEAQGSEELRAGYRLYEERRAAFLGLMLDTRARLEALYASGLAEEGRRRRKRELLDDLRRRYEALRDGPWGGWRGYDEYFSQALNNAHLGAIGAYYDLVPAFEALIRREGGLGPRFYAEVKRIARLPPEQRRALLSGGGG